jgi:hypothetical protein
MGKLSYVKQWTWGKLKLSKNNSFLPQNNDSDLITEQGVLSVKIKPLLIVEGHTDVVLFNSLLFEHNISAKFEDRGGWESVVNFINNWNQTPNINQKAIVVGIIDSDYHHLIPNRTFPENILMTDDRDIEISFFESNSTLIKIVQKYFSQTKIPRTEEGLVLLDEIRQDVYEAARILTRVRTNKVVKNIENLNIRDVVEKFDNIFCYKKFIIERDQLINLLCSNNREIQRDVIISLIDEENILLDDNSFKKYCSGHDVMKIMYYSLRRKYSNKSQNELPEINEFESDFAFSFSIEEFNKLNLSKKLYQVLKVA